jgi:hypothetical protein
VKYLNVLAVNRFKELTRENLTGRPFLGDRGVVQKHQATKISGSEIQIMDRSEDSEASGFVEVGNQIEDFDLSCKIELLGLTRP